MEDPFGVEPLKVLSIGIISDTYRAYLSDDRTVHPLELSTVHRAELIRGCSPHSRMLSTLSTLCYNYKISISNLSLLYLAHLSLC